jgi:hypothetical protein
MHMTSIAASDATTPLRVTTEGPDPPSAPGTSRRVSPNQSRALSYLGRDPSDDELEAIKAILEVLRAKRATFSAHVGSLDGDLTPEDLRDIRARSIALLRRADACGLIPTPLEQLLDVAQLVASGEITLDEEEKRRLRKRFGLLVDLALGKLLGVVHCKELARSGSKQIFTCRRRGSSPHTRLVTTCFLGSATPSLTSTMISAFGNTYV